MHHACGEVALGISVSEAGGSWDAARRCGGEDAAQILTLAPWARQTRWPQMGLAPLGATRLPDPVDRRRRLAEKRRLLAAGAPVFAALPGHGRALAEAGAVLADCAVDSSPGFMEAALGVVDDACIVAPRASAGDAWRLVAGLVCTPSYWRLPSRLGRPIGAIHAPVPGLNEALGARIDDFFERLPAGRVFARSNWFVHGSRLLAQFAEEDREPLDAPERLWLRCEWQTLRRLPASGAILFTIQALTAPATLLAERPALGRRLIAAAEALPRAVRRLRRVDDYLPVLRALLTR